jgi:hypothetical protein
VPGCNLSDVGAYGSSAVLSGGSRFYMVVHPLRRYSQFRQFLTMLDRRPMERKIRLCAFRNDGCDDVRLEAAANRWRLSNALSIPSVFRDWCSGSVRREFRIAPKQLGPRAKQATEAESLLAATTMAVGSNALGMYKRVLVNEWRVGKFPWPEWIRILTHELTHTAQRELVDGRPTASHQWLTEEFAEWVGYKVVDTSVPRTLLTVASKP